MTDDLMASADQVLEAALAATGARDPREFYRDRLRSLKDTNPEGYRSAVAYYRDTLIPAVAGGSEEPLDAWIEYGRLLAETVSPGRTVSIDVTGRARAYAGLDLTRLVLHLADEKGSKALVVGLPTELSPAQHATFDVLVTGKQRLRG